MMNPGSKLGTVERIGGGDFKVLVYGNSIALHGPKPDIGWTNNWGMAASAPERDFAHLVVAGLEAKLGRKADFRIRNLAVLERNFTTNVATVAEIAADANWKPDYVVVAIGENVRSLGKAEASAYRRFLADLARPFAAGGAKVVMRSPFWRDAVKAECTAKAAADVGAVYVDSGPIGASADSKAIGLFSHAGVANHPGDLGMKRLADLILSGFAAAPRAPRASGLEVACRMTKPLVWKGSDGGTLPYRLHVPEHPEPGRLYPLVVHMHGAGSRGTNNVDQIKTGGSDFLRWAASRGEEFVFVAPQCPKGQTWIASPWSAREHRMEEKPTPWLGRALEIIEDAVKRYPVDPDRVYVMGISMGGYATWELLQRRPKLFAAALPCCGGGDTTLAPNLTDVAIWAFHGDADNVVPVYRSQSMVDAIRAAGGRKIRYREYPGVKHNSWTPTFTDPKVFEWLFAQRRGN